MIDLEKKGIVVSAAVFTEMIRLRRYKACSKDLRYEAILHEIVAYWGHEHGYTKKQIHLSAWLAKKLNLLSKRYKRLAKTHAEL